VSLKNIVKTFKELLTLNKSSIGCVEKLDKHLSNETFFSCISLFCIFLQTNLPFITQFIYFLYFIWYLNY